jgi:trimeric autotransporter adhesin
MMKINILCSFLLLSIFTQAQPFTGLYNFAGVTTSSGLTDPTAVPTATGVTFGSFKAVVATTNPNATGRFSFTSMPLGATTGSNTFSGAIDLAKYYEVIIEPQNNFRINLSAITFTFQRSGTGVRQYVVRSSADSYAANLPASINPANANLQVVATNIFQVDDAATAANDGSTITLTGFTNITAPVAFRFYGFNAESNAGTFSIDNVSVTGEALPIAGAPVITPSAGAFVFPSTAFGNTAPIQSYTVLGESLVANMDLAVAAPFSISTDSLTFTNALSLTPAEVATPKKIFVKFAPTVSGSFADSIVHTSTGATTKKISLRGEGTDPANFAFNFNTCTDLGVPGTGFISYSVTGGQLWTCTNFGHNFTRGVNMNGFFGGSQENEDWLISPPLNLGSFNLPVLSFYSRAEFSGLPLELLVSTNYDGVGNPNAATWTTLNVDLPIVGSNVWTLTDNINLEAYKSFPKVFIAYKYISSPVAGSPRWSLDDINITNRTQLFYTNPASLDLGEAAVGASSAGKPISLQAIGYGDITVNAPVGFEVSADNISFSSSIILPVATTTAGTTFFARFTPSVKELKRTGQLNFTGTGFNSTRIMLTASSYPKSQTLDVVTYNMKFFGSSPTNTATQPQKDAQKNNMKIVFDHLNADVVGVQEVSSDSLMGKLLEILPGYAVVLSPRWSASYLPPDPAFPPQKVGFVYKTSTMQLVETRVMFERQFDSARAGFNTIPNYPTGSASNFWSSGRLPFMATFDATINGNSKRIRIISIHAKSGSGANEDYQRRVYDTRILKDSLDLNYATDSVIIVGDYNDPLLVSEYGTGLASPYKIFVDDNQKYEGVTVPLETANRPTYIGSTNGSTIDHHIITNELKQYYVPNSVDIDDPRNYVPNYSNSTSDHLPVFARYDFTNAALPVTITKIDASLFGKNVLVRWATATELNSSYFLVERSVDGIHFESIGKVAAAGSSIALRDYIFTDTKPAEGINFYRIKTVDTDGRFAYTAIVKISIGNIVKITMQVFPNPVMNSVKISLGNADAANTAWQLISGDGKILLQGKGNAAAMNTTINSHLNQLNKGMYLLKANTGNASYIAKFIKE